MSILRWPSYFLRSVAIAAVTTAALVAYAVLRVQSLFIRDSARRAAAVARARGRVLRWAMATLGATFVKLGQVMSSRPDLFPPEMIDELRKLQDRLPPFAYRHVERILREDLGDVGAVLTELDPIPVAAASVAQVHRGRLRDGTRVAVKVLRPSVRRKAERDGAILVGLARVLELSPQARMSEPVAHLRHFVDGIIEQTDLRNEAAHYELFRRNFAGRPGVVFPRVYPVASSERVLTMDFLEGTKLDALGPGPHREVAARTRATFFQMCFEDGFVHADLHPGNMLLTADGTIAIFDVGLVKRLGDDVLTQLIDFSKCLAVGTADDFVAHLRRFHHYMEDVDWDAVQRDAVEFVARFRGLSSGQLEMGQVINDTFAVSRRHRIRPVPDLTLILVGIVTSEGLAKMLDPTVDTFREIAGFLMPLLARRGLGLASAA